jgi:A-factor biosynthesis hotdog domain
VTGWHSPGPPSRACSAKHRDCRTGAAASRPAVISTGCLCAKVNQSTPPRASRPEGLHKEKGDYGRAADLRRRLLLRNADAAPQQVLLGQGSSNADSEVLTHARARAFVHEQEPRASVEQTHKRADEHVLITRLKPIGDHSYQCELYVNEVADRLSDHVTGQHFGGMLLVEAGRQACIAALEAEYGVDGEMGLAWSDLSARFLRRGSVCGRRPRG